MFTIGVSVDRIQREVVGIIFGIARIRVSQRPLDLNHLTISAADETAFWLFRTEVYTDRNRKDHLLSNAAFIHEVSVSVVWELEEKIRQHTHMCCT